MSEKVSVSVSGAAFSLLLYENVKSEHDQEGFLLGNIVCKETNKLTDEAQTVVNRACTITVTVKSVIPCPQLFYFYDAAGKVNVDKIRNVLGNQKDSVVGWYISKRKRPASTLTLREKIIHKQLAGFFSQQIHYFSCCLLNSNTSEVRPNYSLSQTFLRYHMSKFENLPLHIVNLGDPTYTLKSGELASDFVNKMVEDVKNSGQAKGYQVVIKVQDSLQEHMKKLVAELAEKEQELFKLEQEVKELQYNLKLKRENGVEEKEINVENLEAEALEHGTESSSSCAKNSLGNPKKKRGRPKKENSTNSILSSPEKGSDLDDDHMNGKEPPTPKSRSTRSGNNIPSYSEMVKKNKN